jgi:hypothetical protein
VRFARAPFRSEDRNEQRDGSRASFLRQLEKTKNMTDFTVELFCALRFQIVELLRTGQPGTRSSQIIPSSEDNGIRQFNSGLAKKISTRLMSRRGQGGRGWSAIKVIGCNLRCQADHGFAGGGFTNPAGPSGSK